MPFAVASVRRLDPGDHGVSARRPAVRDSRPQPAGHFVNSCPSETCSCGWGAFAPARSPVTLSRADAPGHVPGLGPGGQAEARSRSAGACGGGSAAGPGDTRKRSLAAARAGSKISLQYQYFPHWRYSALSRNLTDVQTRSPSGQKSSGKSGAVTVSGPAR
jgi:hypothetical protein